ncbi:SPFH domain-containing protein [Acidiphilium sp.]|uniref:SPFH domain-containing protein n=1 Tax=Acidiphilium sp. TaxID=527 RepID=UPI003D07D832
MAESPISRLLNNFNQGNGRPPPGSGLQRPSNPLPVGWLGLVVIVALALFVLSNCFYVVQPNEMAGVTRLGVVVTPTPVRPGVHFKLPFIETVDPIQTSISRLSLPDVQVYTADNQLVTLGISLTYQVPPSAVMHLLYDVGKAGNLDINRTIEPIIADRALRVFASHKTINISERRAIIDEQMHVAISKALKRLFGINVIDIQIRSIAYTHAFDRAVEEAVEAKASAVKEQNLVQEKQFMAEQVVATADGAAKARIAQAKGEAEATVLRATAKAQSIVIVAKARALSIAQVGKAAGDNPAIIPYAVATHWNGKLPTTTVGGGSGSNLFRVLLPAAGLPAAK